MRLSRFATLLLSLFGVYFGRISQAQANSWSEFPTTDQASAIGTDFVIGKNDSGQIFHYTSGGFNAVTGSFATTISMDLSGNPWVVNSSGKIFFWNGSGFTQFDSSDTTHTWASVAVGNSASGGEIWAIDTSGTVYANGGTKTSPGLWIEFSGSSATKIAVFTETTTCATEGSINVPWAINSSHQVFQYQVDASTDCLAGGFVQYTTGGAAATDITQDWLLGTDGNVYEYFNGAWGLFLDAPTGGLTNICGFSNGSNSLLWGLNSSGDIWQVDFGF